MAAARPSRQQLQLSTSTSDAVNCTEFSNLEVGTVDRSRGVNVSVVHGDDDFIYPPFRHRGLPHPPATCHPSCDPQWNCSNCSSCHPLMRMSPPDLYYSRAYSAVYESVEDDEDDAIQRSENEGTKQQSCTTPVNTDCIDQMHSCLPCQVSPTSISTVQLRPRTYDDIINRHLIAETGFNGEERLENNASSTIHKYFELEQNVALSGQNDWGINQDYNFTNSLGICINSGESYNPGSTDQSNNPLVTAPCQQDILNHSQIQPYHTSDIHRHSTHCADDLYKYISNEESVEQTNEKMNSKEQQNVSLDQSQIFNNQRTDSNRFDGSNIHYLNNRGKQTIQPKHVIPAGCNVSQIPYSNHVCTSASTFLRDIPTHYYCPSCQHDTASSCVRPQRFAHEQHNVANDHNIHRVNVGPDLLKEASNPSRVKEPEMTPPNDLNNDNAEVPLRKPVLALHSHYFAKTWLA